MKTWLFLDCNYLAHRAFHSTPELFYRDVPTGVTYGFLRDVVTLVDLFGTTRIAFCFDCGVSLRRASCPTYKTTRWGKMTPEEVELRNIFTLQLKHIRNTYLPDLGFKNI